MTTKETGLDEDILVGGLGGRSIKLLALLVFVGSSLALYWNALSFDFLNYDDAFYVRDNAHLNAGFSWAAVRWAFEANLLTVDRSAEYWMPITMLSRLLDAQLFGGNAGWHHLQNIVVHGFNAWLVFVVFAEVTGAMARSALVAALFLVHPINAEVVCWIALRKDVLAGAASLLTILLYLRFVRKPTLVRYLATLLVFMGALMCKPSAVALPLALFLMDWWPLNRLQIKSPGAIGRRSFAPALTVLAEKVPFLIVALVISLVSLVGQQDMGMAAISEKNAVWVGLGRTAVGYVDYLGRVFLMDPFCALYPVRPWETISRLYLWNSAVVLVGVTLAALWLTLRTYRPPLMGWAWFLGLLLPVSAFVQFGRQATADRYMYLPLIGLLIFFVWLLSDLLAFRGSAQLPAASRWRTAMLGVSALGLLGLLAQRSHGQCLTWRNDLTVWTQVIAVEPDGEVAFNNFGSALSVVGDYKVAETYLRAALKISHSVEQYGNLGKFLARYGDPELARPFLERAIQADPSQVENHRWLVLALRREGKIELADAANARYEQLRGRLFLVKGLDYLYEGDTDRARGQLSSAASALLRAQKFTKSNLELLPAVKWLTSARDRLVRLPSAVIAPDDRVMLQAYLSYLAGDVSSAARFFGSVADRQPQHAEPRWRLAICRAELGQMEAAESEATTARECRVAFEEGSSDWHFLRGENAPGAAVGP